MKILKACQHAEGTVIDVAREPDGDYHIWFTVDRGYESLLNPGDHVQGVTALLAEITPDCPLDSHQPDAETAAKCPKTKLAVPTAGDHIAVDGPWVFDFNHGWNEIHPVDAIQITHT